jgi:hypothetical protein
VNLAPTQHGAPASPTPTSFCTCSWREGHGAPRRGDRVHSGSTIRFGPPSAKRRCCLSRAPRDQRAVSDFGRATRQPRQNRRAWRTIKDGGVITMDTTGIWRRKDGEMKESRRRKRVVLTGAGEPGVESDNIQQERSRNGPTCRSTSER